MYGRFRIRLAVIEKYSRNSCFCIKISGAGAVLTGVTFFALRACVSLIAFFTFFALISLFAFDTVGARRFHAGVGFADPPVAVFADEGSFAVTAAKGREVIKIQPDLVARITPLKRIFVYAEFGRFAVLAVCALLSGRTCYIGKRNEILPRTVFITPLYVRIGFF